MYPPPLGQGYSWHYVKGTPVIIISISIIIIIIIIIILAVHF